MRDTWAITVATDKRWSGISDGEAAMAMGHDLFTHIKHYQQWISSEAVRKKQCQISNLKIIWINQ